MVNFILAVSLSGEQLNRAAANDDNIHPTRRRASDSDRLYHFFVSAREKVKSINIKLSG
jgi:hypothetical protein